MNPPTVNLQPGQTSSDVMQLQKWLMSQGYSIPDGPTNYFGPETKAALTKWQSDHGVNTQGNPGYYGPITMSAIKSLSTKTTPPTPAQTTTNATTQKAILSAVADVANTAATTGHPILTFSDALKQVQADPNLLTRYADSLKLDKLALQQTVQQLKDSTSTTQELYKTQFENDRKKLAEAQAQAGTAYSGFRGKAQADLAQEESAVIQSSKADLEKNVNDLTSSFEKTYGTSATPKISVPFSDPLSASNVSISGLKTTPSSGTTNITGEKAGGIAGSIANQAASNLQSGQTALTAFPNV